MRASINTGYTRDEATGAVSFEEAGVAFSATTIDFSKSRWMNPTLLVGGLAVNANSNKNDDVWNTGYAIETGNPSEPIVLTFNEQQMRVFGRAEVKMFGLVSMTGVLDFSVSESAGLTAFADVNVQIGPEGFNMKRDATGLLVINSGGVALRMNMAANLDLGPVAKLNAELKTTVAKIDQLRKDIDAIVAEIEGEEQAA